MPFLVLHGGLGLDHGYFRPWLDRLDDVARLVFLDHRGNGRSPEPADWATFGVGDWCRDIDSVRAAHRCERAVVLGHSVAGFLALEYARRHQDRVAGLVLVGCTPVVDYGEDIFAAASARGTAEQVDSLTALFTAPSLDDETFRRHYLTVLPLYFHRFDPAFGERIASSTPFNARAFLHGRANLLAVADARPWLAELAMPALVVSGDDDIFTPLEQAARRLAAGLPDAELAVVEGSGHFPFVEKPERFAEVVSGWLERRRDALGAR